jgi:hypothetical protein
MILLLALAVGWLVVLGVRGYIAVYLSVLVVGIILCWVFLTKLFKNGEKFFDRTE